MRISARGSWSSSRCCGAAGSPAIHCCRTRWREPRPAIDAIDAIAGPEKPDFTDQKAALVQLGEQSVVEQVGILGYYSLVALMLNAFEIGLLEGEMREITALGRRYDVQTT
jgi:hypothetical protein